jgi:hypothetical protein
MVGVSSPASSVASQRPEFLVGRWLTSAVIITAADFAKLTQNEGITVPSSSDDGHTHDVTVNCG